MGLCERRKDGHEERLGAGLGAHKVGQEAVRVMKGGSSVRGVEQRK